MWRRKGEEIIRELANWRMRKWGVQATPAVKLGNLGMRKWGGVRS